jgi:ABC-type sugar transport system permease subunit
MSNAHAATPPTIGHRRHWRHGPGRKLAPGHRREVLAGLALLAPTIVGILAVSLYPVIRTFLLSTRDTTLAVQQDAFVGLNNFARLLGDATFVQAWVQTIVFTAASTALETVLGFVIALVIHQNFRGRGLVRAAVLVPWAIPTVVTSKMFGFLFNGDNGVINHVLVKLHVISANVNFVGDTDTALATIVVADVWKTTPFMALLILAGLQTISPTLLESARVDGASVWQTFWRVKLPLVMPSLLIAALLRALDAFRIFDLPYVLTGGGPANSTATLSLLAYQRTFGALELGYGSAISTAMFVTEIVIAGAFAVFLVRRFRALEA